MNSFCERRSKRKRADFSASGVARTLRGYWSSQRKCPFLLEFLLVAPKALGKSKLIPKASNLDGVAEDK